MATSETLNQLRMFWTSEIMADSLYGFLAARYGDDGRKQSIMAIGTMERGHAAAWQTIAAKIYGVSFRVSFLLKFKIMLLKLLSFVLPFTIFVYYMEHEERNAILGYADLLESFRDNEEIRTMITNILKHEIGHQWHMMEQIADKGSYIMKAREALPGMTAGIIETLGLVMGLLAVHLTTLTIGLTGLIAMMSGMTAIMSISYISSKGHHDLHEGRTKELHIKKEVHPGALRRELEHALLDKGIDTDTVKLIVETIGADPTALANLLRTIAITGESLVPRETVKINGIFYAIGTAPILAPFFVGAAWNADPLIPACIAFAFALVSLSIAGLFIAVLAGKKISLQIIHNISIVMGTCAATYLVGFAARVFFGIGVPH